MYDRALREDNTWVDAREDDLRNDDQDVHSVCSFPDMLHFSHPRVRL